MKKCLLLVEGPYDKQRLSTLIGLFNQANLKIFPLSTDYLTHADYYKKL